MSYVVWFKELNKDSLAIAGGKGSNLGEMYTLGMPVPNGFAVTASAYQEFIEKTGLKDKIQQLLQGLNVEDTDSLQDLALQIQQLIQSMPIPEAMAEEIKDNYELLGTDKQAQALVQPKEVFVAVRSSATAEDLPSIAEDEHVLVTINGKPIYQKMKEICQLSFGQNEIRVPALENNCITWKLVSQIYKHPVPDKNLYKITTVSGREITISPNHTLITLNEDSLTPQVIQVSELRGGEKIPTISMLPEIQCPDTFVDVLDYVKGDDVVELNGQIYIKNNSMNWTIQHPLPRFIKFTPHFAYFLGIYAAEGSTYKTSDVSVTNSDPKIQKRVKDFLDELGINKDRKINKHSIRFSGRALVRFLHAVGGEPLPGKRGKGKLCSPKRVPNFVFGWKKELIGEFLSGAFDGDGGMEHNGVGYCSTSPFLIGGIVKLLEILNLEFLLRRRNGMGKWSDHFRLIIPNRNLRDFQSRVAFKSIQKATILREQLVSYEAQQKYFQQLRTFTVSPVLAQKIKSDYEKNLPKVEQRRAHCPSCTKFIQITSYNKKQRRFYCRSCKKVYYEPGVIWKEDQFYKYYDEKGRFIPALTPWNRGLISGTMSQREFAKRMEKLGLREMANFFSGSVQWDTIKSIETIPYQGDVYDFTVPEVENFAAGIGGIITHNSASFAGQQATFLNVKGKENVVKAVLACWASLFTARAIYYREKNKFDHLKVLISAIVQKMVDAEKSGIMFTINPATNSPDEVVIEAIFGLGEMIVGGEVNPNTYLVDKNARSIKKMEVRKQEVGLFRNERGANEKKAIPKSMQERQVLDEKQIHELARLGKKLEEHYGRPQDVEWAVERGEIFIVQTRAITTFKPKWAGERSVIAEEAGKIILKGETASAGVASGKVKIVHDPSELHKVEKGDILVTKMTSPDEVPAMQRAAAIVTDEGGMTCFSSDTKVLTNRGFYTFGKIYAEMSKDEVYFVPSLSVVNGKIVWRKILATTKRIGSPSQIQVSPTLRSTQNYLKVTRDHKFLTLDARKLVKKQIGEIIDNNVGVLLAERIPSIQDNKTTQNKAYLMGALLSDGHITKPKQGGYVVGFTQKLLNSKEPFITSVLSNFKEEYGKHFSFKLDPRGDVGQFQCFSKSAYDDVVKFKNEVVLEILTMSEQNLLYFLAGIIDGDGTVGQHQIMITVGENKKNILEAVVLSCLRLGIQSNVCKTKTWYTIHISEKISELLTYTQRVKSNYERYFDGKKFVAKQVIGDIIDEINQRGKVKFAYLGRDQMISSQKIKSLLQSHNISKKTELDFILNSEFRMWRVKEEQKLEETEVFNLTIEADNDLDHNYVVFTENYSPVIVGNCHAAIVSREMGIPCLVGTEHATELLKDNEIVTVHASRGVVYEGNVGVSAAAKAVVSSAQESTGEDLLTATEIKVILDLPDFAEKAAATGTDGVGLVRSEIIIANGGIHPAEYIRQGKVQDYIALLKSGIGKIAQAFKGKPVWVRCSDMRSDEYRNLQGGDKEPKESDPMIGWHGVRRLLDEPDILNAEFQAVRELHATGMKNVGIMLPFVIRVEELKQAKEIMRGVGLEPCSSIEFGVMVETPAACWIIEELCREGISFVSFGTNDLTQLTLGIDRNNERIADRFDELHPAVLGEMAKVIRVCKKYGVKTSICGQAGSKSKMAEFLVHQGVDSISANVDAVGEIRKVVARTERKLMLEKKRT